MRLQLFPEIVQEKREDFAVVIDIYRATSNIISLFARGAKEIHLIDNKIKNADSFLYVGEENGEPIEGFDYTNSPTEMQNFDFTNKKIKLKTTNGTKLIRKLLPYYTSIFPLSFLNFHSLAVFLKKHHLRVDIYCAGNSGEFSLEDALCGLDFFKELSADRYDDYFFFWENLQFSHLKARESHHAHRLKRLGYEKDVEFCLNYDYFDIVCQTDEKGVLRLSDR
jgi:2-phosphosulfolactate phosphatase